jgi:hypothetical protein
MNKQWPWLWAALLVLSIGPGAKIAQAQRASAGAAKITAPPRVVPTQSRFAPARSAAVIPRAVSRSTARVMPTRSRVSPNGFVGFDGTGAGLFTPGFGFSHLGTADQDLWIKAAIDPATQWRLFEKRRFLGHGGFGSGFYLLDGGAYYEPPIEPLETEQAPPPEQAAPAEARSTTAPPEERHVSSEPSVPVEDVGQFVLVLRNGTELPAVAFTRTKDRVVYVTIDGLRRTLALADLDVDATRRINEERGTPLEIQL